MTEQNIFSARLGGESGFDTEFPIGTKQKVIDAADSSASKLAELAELDKSTSLTIALELDQFAYTVATKGKSKEDRIKSGQQQAAYKSLSKWLKEQHGMDVNASRFRQARYLHKKKQREAAGESTEPAQGSPEAIARQIATAIRESAKQSADAEAVAAGFVALADKAKDLVWNEALVKSVRSAFAVAEAVFAEQEARGFEAEDVEKDESAAA